MRKVSTLVGLMVIALGAGARAQDRAPTSPLPDAASAAPAAPPPSATVTMVPAASEPPAPPIELGLSLISMGRGKLSVPGIGSANVETDAQFAYGVGLSATYHLVAGLHVGLAPQAIFNVNYKTNPAGNGIALPDASKEYDLLARVQYAFPLLDGITLYLEALPGYSLISIPGGNTAAGLVLVGGGGAAIDMSDRIFVNLGAAYQVGLQTLAVSGMSREYRTQYVRVAIGVGARF